MAGMMQAGGMHRTTRIVLQVQAGWQREARCQPRTATGAAVACTGSWFGLRNEWAGKACVA